MDLRRAALRATFWSAIQQAGDKGIRLPVYLVLARLLPPEAFGLVALAAVYIDFIELFLNQGLTSAIVQREDLREEHLDSVFWGNMAFAIALSGMSLSTAGVFARIVNQPGLESVVRWLAIAFVLTGLSAVQGAILRRELRFKVLAIRSLVSQTISGIVGIALAVAGFGVWSLVAMLLLNQGLSVLLLWRASDWRPCFRFSLDRYREMFAFGVAIMSVNVVQFLRKRADNLLIGAALGATALGFYSMARQIMNGVAALASGIVGPVVWSTLPRLQRESGRLGRAIYQTAEMLAVMTWPAYLGIAVVAPELVDVVLGDRWLPIVPVIRAFALAAVVQSVNGLNLTAITAIGETRWRVGIEMGVAAATLAAIATALPFGTTAVAWAFAASLCLALPVELRIVSRLLPITQGSYLRRLLPPVAASMAMVGIILATRQMLAGVVAGPGMLAALVLAGGVAYAGLLRVIFPGITRRALNNLTRAVEAVSASS